MIQVKLFYGKEMKVDDENRYFDMEDILNVWLAKQRHEIKVIDIKFHMYGTNRYALLIYEI